MKFRNFREYVNHIKSIINMFEEIITDYILEVNEATPYEGFIRGKLTLINGSTLQFLEYITINKKTGEITALKYRYNYIDFENKLIFRYDNAPHHPEIPTHPHHKHLPNGTVTPAEKPTLQKILYEIFETLP